MIDNTDPSEAFFLQFRDTVDQGTCPLCGETILSLVLSDLPKAKQWAYINDVQTSGGHVVLLRGEQQGRVLMLYYHWPTPQQLAEVKRAYSQPGA